jgi:hypothetical protein
MSAIHHCFCEPGIDEPMLDPVLIRYEADLLIAAIYIDRYLLDAMNRLEQDFAKIHFLSTQTFKQITRNKYILNDKILTAKEKTGDDTIANLEKVIAYNEQMEEKAENPGSKLQRLCVCCNRSIIFYEAIVAMTADENIRSCAQKLALSVNDRMKILEQAPGRECRCDCSDNKDRER